VLKVVRQKSSLIFNIYMKYKNLLVFRKLGDLDLTGLKLTPINKTAEQFFELD